MAEPFFAPRGDRAEIEEGVSLSPKFDGNGLLPVVTTDHKTGKVIMLAYMNDLALAKTIETGSAHYWSRSRNELWHKGATSGLTQKVITLNIDCDQDALWMAVEVQGAGCCHVGYEGCFFRSIPLGKKPGSALKLTFNEDQKAFDPKKVYGK